MQTPWEYRYAHRIQKMGSSVIRELLKLTEQPDIISFGGGLPAPEVFPVKEFQEACNQVLTDHGAQALQYSTTEGYLPLRATSWLPPAKRARLLLVAALRSRHPPGMLGRPPGAA